MTSKSEKTGLLGSKGGDDHLEWWSEFSGLCSMAAQVSLATVARIALTSIDAAFVGHLGTECLAAAALAQVWTSTPLMGVWASATALITLCGQAWGAKNYALVGIWLQFGLIITSILSLPVFVWYWGVGYVLQYSTDDTQVVELGTKFARMLSFSIWPSLVYACLRQYFQAMGIMMPTTIVGSFSILLAIVCNYYFIYGFAGWNGLGFVGSPLATVVASWFQPIALATWCIGIKKFHKAAWDGWDAKALTVDRLRVFLSMAGPIATNSLVSNLATSLVSLVAAKMGSDVIASNAILMGCWSLLWAMFWGFGCSAQVRVANYLGAGKPNCARSVARMGYACTAITCAFLATMTFVLNERIFRLYATDPHLIGMVMGVLPLFVVGFLVQSSEIVVASILTGMAKIQIIFWTSAAGTWCIQLPLCILLGLYYKLGLEALWISLGVMEIVKLTVYLVTYWRVDWRERATAAVRAMEAAPVEEEEFEKADLNVITSDIGSKPTGYIAQTPVPPTPLSTREYRSSRWSRLDHWTRQRASTTGI